jgi:hypothetical protein
MDLQSKIFDRDVAMQLYRYEDNLYRSAWGQDLWRAHTRDWVPKELIIRRVLNENGYDDSKQNLTAYDQMFHAHYRGPMDCDREVLNCILRFKFNRCLYYTQRELSFMDVVPEVVVETQRQELVSTNTLYGMHDLTMFAAFSQS